MAQLQRITVTPDQLQGQSLCLTQEQHHYLQRVLRLRSGDRFIANAPDHPWLAELKDTDLAPLLEALPPTPALPVQIHLIAALPKTGFDEVVRQSTELGVGTIWPVLSDRTLLKPSPKKLERWRRIAQEATEQCERADVPQVRDPGGLEPALASVQEAVGDHRRFIGATRAEAKSFRAALDQHPSHLDSSQTADNDQSEAVAIAIGPEGGWTDAEIQLAIALGYIPVSLGPTILRAVTAPLAAIAQIMSQYV